MSRSSSSPADFQGLARVVDVRAQPARGELVEGHEDLAPPPPDQRALVLLQQQVRLDELLGGIASVEAFQVGGVEGLAVELGSPAAVGEETGRALLSPLLAELADDPGGPEPFRAGDDLVAVEHGCVHLHVQLAAVVDDARHHHQVAARHARVPLHERSGVAAVLHVRDPRVRRQHGVERPHQVAAKEHADADLSLRVVAFQAPDQLGRQVHLQRVALQVAGCAGDQVARGVDLLQGRDVLQNGRRLTEQRPRARIVEVRAVLRRPEAVGVGLGVGFDDRAHGLLPDVERGRIAGRHRHAAVALETVALARRQAVIDLGALRGQVGRDEGELAGDQPHLHLARVRVADDLAQERDGDAVGVLLRLDLAELRRAQPFVVVATGADAQVGAGAGGGVHAAAPGARVLADRQVPGLEGRGQLALNAAVGEPDPGRAHAPRELQDVHLQLGELVDQVPVLVQPHVPGVAVPDVHAPELPRRIDRQVEVRHVEGGLASGTTSFESWNTMPSRSSSS